MKDYGATDVVVAISSAPKAAQMIYTANTEIRPTNGMVISSYGTYLVEAKRKLSECTTALSQLQLRMDNMIKATDSALCQEYSMGPSFAAPLSEDQMSILVANAKAGKVYRVFLTNTYDIATKAKCDEAQVCYFYNIGDEYYPDDESMLHLD